MKAKTTTPDLKYLQLLAQTYPSIRAASTEIINLEAILNLPKGTEHFMADIHGENAAFLHVLKNASGNIRRKVRELFHLNADEETELCTLIYYPEEKLALIRNTTTDMPSWYQKTLQRLVKVCREVSSKYTRSKVRKALPEDFGYVIEELLHENANDKDKQAYINSILKTIINTGRADDFIIALCNVIQRLAVDKLHILGDIFDRGPGAHLILETLKNYHDWDIQWGNHDALWMGACAGNDACICNVLRLSLRYANLTTLDEGYGINLMPLATFAMEAYKDDPCTQFYPILAPGQKMSEKDMLLTAQMHKAISIIQFKVEAQIFHRHPEWKMEDRDLLHLIGLSNELTDGEREVMKLLHHSFAISDKLRKHIKMLLSHGCMYAVCNNNLLFHASVPLNADGTMKDVRVYGKKYHGKNLLHRIGCLIRAAFGNDNDSQTDQKEKEYAIDYFIYLWCGPDSPLFGKSKMATFERYFLEDKETWHEEKGYYFTLRDDENIVNRILDSFGIRGKNRHIINGHVPVHVAGGENPIKANGKLMVIDAGFSEPYHKETGVAGCTLVYHSRGFQLAIHKPFHSTKEAIKNGTDIVSTTEIVEMSSRRMRVRDTDKGKELIRQIADLRSLLSAYRHGIINEKVK